KALRHLWSDIANGNPELGRTGFAFVGSAFAFVAGPIAKKLGAVGHRDFGLFLLAIADVREINLAAGLGGRNQAYQLIAGFNWLTVDGDDGAANLQPRLVGRAAWRSHTGDSNSALHAVDARQRRTRLSIKFNADGSTRNLVFGPGQLGVNIADGI